jgi:hypothetical protein
LPRARRGFLFSVERPTVLPELPAALGCVIKGENPGGWNKGDRLERDFLNKGPRPDTCK